MTYICYRGIEVSAMFQRVLLGVELVMLLVFSMTALVRVGTGNHPAGSITPAWSWFNPLQGGFTGFVTGIILMLFIYWGWDTAVAINEETKDPAKTPGRAAILSTVILLVTYVIVILSAQSFAGVGTTGIGLGNADNTGDVISVLGGAVFGGSGFGVVPDPPARPHGAHLGGGVDADHDPAHGADHAVDGDLQGAARSFAKMHPRYLTPTVSTIVMGVVSALLYLAFNYVSQGFVIADAVTAIGLYIAFYYGLTGFACAWYYRKSLRSSQRNLWMQGILPVLGGLIMYAAGGWSIWADWDVASQNSYTSWLMPFWPHWYIGGAFLIAFLSGLVGLIAGIWVRFAMPAYFRKQTLTRATPTLVPDE